MSAGPKAAEVKAHTSATLEKIDLFAAVDEETRRAYEKRCIWQWWEAGASILSREGVSDGVYFIIEGSVRILNYSSSGNREIALDDIREGAYFGEMAAIDGEPRSANVIAVTQTLTARLAGKVFVEFLHEHPQVAVLIMRRFTEIIRSANTRIMDLSTLAAQNRIYADLLRQARTGGPLGANVAVIRPVPRHHAIAARASTTRETVARVLGDLSRRALIRRDGDSLIIEDLTTLTRMVEQFRS